ncbi:xanthine dehydrogenase family protein molybdopterin-binding subunit [Kiloniella majae]|uniref:xanthine dehydrogenase family protein molybdopterin-binding subunit n=1 Tax=Kiloniella majae TaxID=1938558 RepID=UPI000A277B81|nr:molybdopterin cofactor-binding domain-containing protein [Kiloniella majae]
MKNTAFSMTRRSFIKTVAGVSFTINMIPVTELLADETDEITSLNSGDWSKAPGKARYRVDGLVKVTGQKVFARDYHAWNLPGWPKEERPVMIVRATDVNNPFEGLDLSLIPDKSQPDEILYGEKITKEVLRPNKLQDQAEPENQPVIQDVKVKRPSALTWPFIVSKGERASFYGQPVAFLIFKDNRNYRAAKKAIQFNSDFVVYDKKPSNKPVFPFNPLTNYVRVASDEKGKDVFSYAQNGDDKNYSEKAFVHRTRIQEQMASGKWKTYDASCSMQAMDPMFMEPENGLGWYDSKNETLNLLVGTQSPDGDMNDVLEMFTGDNPVVKVKTVNIISCYPGGGFGGRDSSVFTLNLAIAAAYAAGKPIRLAYDRFEQFQAGLKRHACELTESLSVDDQGKIQALNVMMSFDGGGRENLSPWVAQLAGLCAGGSYSIPRAAINSNAMYSKNISGGSQRGFGGPQAFFAIETLLDEVAKDNNWDPIELRRKNTLDEGENTVVGGPITEKLRLHEILDKSEDHDIWRDQKRDKERWRKEGLLYGVGFAMSMQAFGTSGDGLIGYVELDRSGRLTVKTNAVDMGNGSATTLAVSTADHLGRNASSIDMGNPDLYPVLKMSSDKKGSWKEPGWTANGVGSSSACLTAFHQVHAINQASKVLFDTAIVPVAREILGLPDIPAADFIWKDERLYVKDRDLPPIPMDIIADVIHRTGRIKGALVHAYFQEIWVKADFDVKGTIHNWEIDGLAVYSAGQSNPEIIRREVNTGVYPSAASSRYSRTTFAPCGNIIGLTVDPISGEAVVRKSLSVLNAGKIITEELVSGQSQGGVAMAIGYSLLEDMPPGLGGPADGDWNLNQYFVPRAGDVALEGQELITLDPLKHDKTGKGIAEAVMCSVAPAISNALYDATGVRFRDLPITAEKIRKGMDENG